MNDCEPYKIDGFSDEDFMSALKGVIVDNETDLTEDLARICNTATVKDVGVFSYVDGGWALSNHVHAYTVQFTDKEYTADAGDIDSLVNVNNDLFSITDNKTIVFKKAGMIDIEWNVLSANAKLGANTRISFSDGKVQMLSNNSSSGWCDAYLSKKERYVVGSSIHLLYNLGKFHTFPDSGFSYIKITRLGA